MDDGRYGNFMDSDDNDDDDIVQSRKRRRFDIDGEELGVSNLISDERSNQSDARLSTPRDGRPTDQWDCSASLLLEARSCIQWEDGW